MHVHLLCASTTKACICTCCAQARPKQARRQTPGAHASTRIHACLYRTRDTQSVHNAMQGEDVKGDSGLYAAHLELIAKLAAQRKAAFQDGLNVLQDIRRNGVSPDATVFNVLMDVVAKVCICLYVWPRHASASMCGQGSGCTWSRMCVECAFSMYVCLCLVRMWCVRLVCMWCVCVCVRLVCVQSARICV